MELAYQYTDIPESGGVYTYRGVVRLRNGKIVYTDAVDIAYGNEASYFVFPNPLNAQLEKAQVLTNGENLSIMFFDMLGRPVKEQELYGSLFRFSLSDLAPGIYLYQLLRNKKPVSAGRLVIR